MKFHNKFCQSLIWASFAAACLTGIYFRFLNLGLWSLTIDEYYITKSVGSILKHGLPEFECGGYYVRGILQQYLTAPILALSSDPEWAVRLIPAVANVLTMPAVFLIGKRLGGHVVAVAAVFLFCFSTVELEMARFARMYAPFQAFFVWQVYFLLVVMEEHKKWAYNAVLALAIVSVFIYQGSIFLAVISLCPLLMKKVKVSRSVLFFVLLIFLLNFLVQLVDFRHLGVANLENAAKGGSSIISHPKAMASSFSKNTEWLFFVLIPMLLFVRTMYFIWLKKKRDFMPSAMLTFFFVCLVFNQLALASLFLILGMLTGLIENYPISIRSLRDDEPIFTAAVGLFGYWMFYALFFSGASIFNSFKIFLEYPNIYDYIFTPWFDAFPIFVCIMSFCTVAALWFSMKTDDDSMKIILSVVLLMCMIVGGLSTTYKSARYTFFLYPLFLIVISYFATKIILNYKNKISFSILFLLLILYFSEDFNLKHFLKVDKPEMNFRTNYDKNRTNAYYKRFDFENAAHYINRNFKNGDKVISFLNVVDYYLDTPLDYRYLDPKSVEYKNLLACDGKNEIWSHAVLVQSYDELEALLESAPGVWVVSSDDEALPRAASLFNSRYSDNLRFTGIDGYLKVFKF